MLRSAKSSAAGAKAAVSAAVASLVAASVARSENQSAPPLLPPCRPLPSGDAPEPSPFQGSYGSIKEYRTGKVFPLSREPIPPQEETNDMFGEDVQITQAASLLGSNVRCMLGWCRLAIARAYAFGLYANDDALVGGAQALAKVLAEKAAAADAGTKTKAPTQQELLPAVLDWLTFIHANVIAEAEENAALAAARKRKLSLKRPSDSALEFAFAQPIDTASSASAGSGKGASNAASGTSAAKASASIAPEFSLVLVMARAIDGAHLAHGFKNSVLFRVPGVEKRIAYVSNGKTGAAAIVDPVAATVAIASHSGAASAASSPAGVAASTTVPTPVPDAAALRADALASGKANIPAGSSVPSGAVDTTSSTPSSGAGIAAEDGADAASVAPPQPPLLEELYRFIGSFHGVQFSEGDEVVFTWQPSTGKMITAFRNREKEKEKTAAATGAGAAGAAPGKTVAEDPTIPIASDPLLPAHMDVSTSTASKVAPTPLPAAAAAPATPEAGNDKKADAKDDQEEDDSDWDGLLTRVVKGATLTHPALVRALFDVYCGANENDPRFAAAPGKPTPKPVSARAKATFEANFATLAKADNGILVPSAQQVPAASSAASAGANTSAAPSTASAPVPKASPLPDKPLLEFKRWLKGKLSADGDSSSGGSSGSASAASAHSTATAAAAATVVVPCLELRPDALAEAVKREHASRTK